MFVKLRPGVNFTNVLLKSFIHKDPKKHKKTDGFTVFFSFFLGSACLKAAKMFVKLRHRVDFINILIAVLRCADP